MNPFSDKALSHLREALCCVLTCDLQLGSPDSSRLAAEFFQVLRDYREDALPFISRRLRETGIRARWNQILSRERPAVLTSWLLPHCKGPVLDLLCGDGRVGECLTTNGSQVTLAERSDSYSLVRNHDIPFIDFDTLTATDGLSFSTVLLCTVLHHEIVPEDLLRFASRLCLTRLIVVENCIDNRFRANHQLLFDIFFSRCLNSFALPTAGNHCTFSHWLSLLSRYGRLRIHERRESLPGIPLPHDLIVIDLE